MQLTVEAATQAKTRLSVLELMKSAQQPELWLLPEDESVPSIPPAPARGDRTRMTGESLVYEVVGIMAAICVCYRLAGKGGWLFVSVALQQALVLSLHVV